ncbi:unnamed protein product [Parnassius apollo]|uniref:(apollo) hypothetical protein n=1 Tax=Parnassius apollo TaxID=110799 RepID=A0A8S3XMV1_PARAO|nr:unnamed protein product [Parnassius apollo]
MSLRLVLLLAAAAFAVAAPDPWLSDIGLKIHSELYDAMGMIEVNYSDPIINTTYVSGVEFDMRAMGALYNSTHMIIDFIVNKQAYPEGDAVKCMRRGGGGLKAACRVQRGRRPRTELSRARAGSDTTSH